MRIMNVVLFIIVNILVPFQAYAAKIYTPKEIADQLVKGPNGRGLPGFDGVQDRDPAIDLPIQFEFDSAELTAEGRLLVGNLNRALRDPRIKDHKIQIEGHTDGRGTEQYNLQLSKRRAIMVKDTLVNRYGIESSRLIVKWYGKSQLKNPNFPEAPENRRVTARTL